MAIGMPLRYKTSLPYLMEAPMFKVAGFDKFTKQLEEAQKALAEIDGEIGTVSFAPNDPMSIEQAVKSVEAMIDARLGKYHRNPIIGPLIGNMKEQYRHGILEKAAAARLKDDE